MKVVNPNNTNHDIKLIPRWYDFAFLNLELHNESTQVNTSVDSSFSVLNGVLTLNFDFDFLDNDKFQFKLTDGESVVYRDKIIATSQEPQEYKLSKGLYSYE